MSRRFGFECELASGALDTLSILVDTGLASPNNRRLHDYHCGCSSVCDYTSRWAIRGQRDCTADGELITKILTYGTGEADSTIAGLSAALLQARATTNTDVGFHVHVDRTDLDTAAKVRLVRMYMRYQDELAELAATRFRNVRGYNSPLVFSQNRTVYNRRNGRYEYATTEPSAFWNADITGDRDVWNYVRGTWLVEKSATFEFRLWNATRAEWRMHLATGVSTAMVEAAKDGLVVKDTTPDPLEFVLGDYLDDRTWAYVIRQRHYKGGIAA